MNNRWNDIPFNDAAVLYTSKVFEFLTKVSSKADENESERIELKRICNATSVIDDAQMSIGLFTKTNVSSYIQNTVGKVEAPWSFVNHAVDKLTYFGVLKPYVFANDSGTRYEVDSSKIAQFIGDAIYAVIFGMTYILGRANKVVYQICVSDNSGEHVGTGFLTNVKIEGKTRDVIVTNRHVVDTARYKILSIKNSDSEIPLQHIYCV